MKRPILAVLTAMRVEAGALIEQLGSARESKPIGLLSFDGLLGDNRVIVVITEMGKVSAALASQYVCDHLRPQYLLSAGLAGGLSPLAVPGTIIVANAALQHDYDARPIASHATVVPHLGMSRIPADEGLSAQLKRSGLESTADAGHLSIIDGLVVSGDRIVRSTAERDRIKAAHWDALCVDMESAAVSQVAYQNQVPWGGLRIVSDGADEKFDASNVIDYARRTASEIIASVVTHSVAALGDGSHRGDDLDMDSASICKSANGPAGRPRTASSKQQYPWSSVWYQDTGFLS